MDVNYYNSRLDIDLDKIGENLDKIQRYTGGLTVLPVVKSNAYGLIHQNISKARSRMPHNRRHRALNGHRRGRLSFGAWQNLYHVE